MFTRSEAGKLGYQKTQEALKNRVLAQKSVALAKYEANHPCCLFCRRLIPYEKRTNKFCNHSCAASFNNLGVTHNPRKVIRRTHCLRCSQPILGAGILYCCWHCSHAHRLEKFTEKMLCGVDAVPVGSVAAIRRCLIRLRGEKCELCGWHQRHLVTGKVPLEVDHTDGNYENNRITNLRLLCPNCHSLTPTYRNLNKGNGRAYRRKTPQ